MVPFQTKLGSNSTNPDMFLFQVLIILMPARFAVALPDLLGDQTSPGIGIGDAMQSLGVVRCASCTVGGHWTALHRVHRWRSSSFLHSGTGEARLGSTVTGTH